jgi:hypothetical protein
VSLDSRPRQLLTLVALAALSLPLLMYAVVGWFSRYAADDYCMAAQVVQSGVFQAQSHLYVGWSGRFGATLLITSVEGIGIGAVPLIAPIGLLAWVTATTWALREIARVAGWRLGWLASLVIGVLLVYATLEMTADMAQDVYWQTGLLTYLSPLVFASLFVGWVARGGMSGWPVQLGVSFGLALLAGGTSETFAAVQVAALAIACLAVWWAGSRRTLVMLLAGMLGALVALAIVAAAPGNEVRQSISSRTPLAVALPEAAQFTQGWLRLTFARPHAVTLALLLCVPAAIAAASARDSRRPIGHPVALVVFGAVALLLVLLSAILPAYYALGTNPPGRAQLIPEFVLVCATACAGWWLGSAFAHVLRQPAALGLMGASLVVLLVLGPLRTAAQAAADITAARAYAANWDQVDSQVRDEQQRGVEAVSVPPLTPVHNLDFVGPDRGDWFNQCVASYYRVGSIATAP